MRILTSEEMRWVDRAAVDELSIPSLLLMENAAIGVVDTIGREFPEADSAAVFCGPGNNGGDGLAVARHLVARGLGVVAVVANGGRLYTGDARTQLEIARRLAERSLELIELVPDQPVREAVERARECDLVVDALFGTGLSRPLEGQFAELVQAIDGLPCPCVAVDLPSGLSGDGGAVPGPHVQADFTVTFAAPKHAHVFPPAALAAGTLVVTDLGVPADLVERAPGDLRLLEPAELAMLLGPRAPDAHKGDFGHLLVVAGSVGKSGAAILEARGALRAGAGLVTAAVPETVLASFEGAAVECMSTPLPVDAAGELGTAALDALAREVAGKDAVALGPGLGASAGTASTVREFCRACPRALVLDADGLNAFAGRLEALAERSAPTLLTPHPGELARLLGTSTKQVVADRLAAARDAAARSHSIVVLKGHRTLIADPAGGVYVNPTGNPGMATAGAGDVLTGVVGALVAQGLETLAAAQLGAYLHGAAGDLAAERFGETSLTAGDLLDCLPDAVLDLAAEAGDA